MLPPSLTQGLCRKSLGLTLRRAVEQTNKPIDQRRRLDLFQQISALFPLAPRRSARLGAKGRSEFGLEPSYPKPPSRNAG
jgi:hypothetical protein